MNFIRPDARMALLRWRGPLAFGAISALGLWWIVSAYGILNWLGYVVFAAGAILLLASLQKMRFDTGRDGPGVVRVDEGAIAYFGPLTGGAVALSEMSALILDHTAKPPHWRITQPGQPDLNIPLSADGADALFDVFASLPGIKTERMLTQMRRHQDHETVIWRRDPDTTGIERLHPPNGANTP